MSRFGTLLRNLSALILLAASSQAAPLSPEDTAALLKNLQAHRAKFPSLTADFTEERNSHLLAKPLKTEGTLSFQAPNKFRRDIRGAAPSITVSDGTKLWIYYPNFKQAELYTLGVRAFFDDSIAALTAGLNFQHVADFYRYTAERDGENYRLVLTPKTSGLKRVLQSLTVTVDAEYKIDRTEALLPKGDKLVTTYRNQRSVAVPAGTFDFTPPADATVTQPLGK